MAWSPAYATAPMETSRQMHATPKTCAVRAVSGRKATTSASASGTAAKSVAAFAFPSQKASVP